MLTRRALVSGGLASLLMGHEAVAQSVLPLDLGKQADARVDALIKDAMERKNISALSLAIVKDGIIKCAGYGIADRENNIRATPETAYNIGSVGKQFLAAGVVLLVEDRQMRLDDEAVRYLRGAPAEWSGITVRHLLTHTSGLRREPVGYDPNMEQSDAHLIRNSYGNDLLFRPGSGFAYSNLGYFVLAEVVRVVTGDRWSRFIEKRVFAPAGLNMTRPADRTDSLPRLATGYRWRNGRWIHARNPRGLRPSGAFFSTALDLAKWDRALRTDQVLTRASREAMWARVSLSGGEMTNYGFGWVLAPRKGRVQLVFHTGPRCRQPVPFERPGWRIRREGRRDRRRLEKHPPVMKG